MQPTLRRCFDEVLHRRTARAGERHPYAQGDGLLTRMPCARKSAGWRPWILPHLVEVAPTEARGSSPYVGPTPIGAQGLATCKAQTLPSLGAQGLATCKAQTLPSFEFDRYAYILLDTTHCGYIGVPC